MSLTNKLRYYRNLKALSNNLPKHTVFSNDIIQQLVKSKPTDTGALSKITGIGVMRMDKYGRDIVQIIMQDTKQKTKPIGSDIDKAQKNTTPVKPQKTNPIINKPQKATPIINNTQKATPIINNPQKAAKVIVVHNGKCTSNRVHNGKCTSNRAFQTKKNEPLIMSKIKSVQPIPTTTTTTTTTTTDGVYILQLSHNQVYVGKSSNIPRRITEHMNGIGSAFTRKYKPTGVVLPRLGNISGSGDAVERDETIRYMYLHGINNVRGWRYTSVDLSCNDIKEAERDIREVFDLCRKCGIKGHFAGYCKQTVDRHGKKI
jgi:predicted GIY-YIG superfamily endonuclease